MARTERKKVMEEKVGKKSKEMKKIYVNFFFKRRDEQKGK